MVSFYLTRSCRGLALGLASLFLVSGGARGGVVRTFGGEVYEGEVRTDVGGLNVVPKGQGPRRVELGDLLRADFLDKAKGADSGQGVQLRNGSIIGGKLTGIDVTAVHLTVGGATRDFPLADVARVVFDFVPDSVSRKIPPGFVGAILPGGDLMPGECRGLEDKPPTVKINSPILGVHHFDYKTGEILAVAFHDPAPTPAASFHVRAVDGSMYNAATLELGVDGVTLRDLAGAEQKVGLKQIAQILAGETRYALLGSLRAAGVTSMNPTKVPAVFTADEMPGGGPIKLAGQELDSGIVQAAGVAVTYLVPPGFSVFAAKIGLPDGSPAGASVSYTLLADNRPVWRTPQPVVAGAAPLPVRWNLGTSIHTLTIFVEPAQPASLGTPAVWANATLLKP